ncbi:hypothetical protein RHSIM_Rhsim02G0127400 [Rhododendron simsii]|uniref:SWIM-type domain-containing protein n=1 Tax=Rhododendron simsii TaxID=118357 RepID=A0A834LTP3_RHOSS|nr:hypothetical protein RHSIM_Rhsim02G0127400 [Rhododendron simsii]
MGTPNPNCDSNSDSSPTRKDCTNIVVGNDVDGKREGEGSFFDVGDIFRLLTDTEIAGIKFCSEDEAGKFYNAYAKAMGIGIRKSRSKPQKNNDSYVRCQTWVCSREGKRQKKHLQRVDRIRHPRAETRIGCGAKFRVRYLSKTQKYIVTHFISAHNHLLAAEHCVPFLWSHQCVNDADTAQATAMRKYKVDEEDRLETLFWADGKSRMDYATFGDVLVFDTTYRTNAYKKPFVILASVSNQFMATIFGCALLSKETEKTCNWVLEMFMEAVDAFGLTMVSHYGLETNALVLEMYKDRARWAGAFLCRDEEHSAILFQDEIQRTSPLIVARRVDELRHRLYFIEMYSHSESNWMVEYYPMDSRMKCRCMMFESFGLPCCHMIVVMKYEHLLVISCSLLMRRWTRSARPASQLPTVPQISCILTHMARVGRWEIRKSAGLRLVKQVLPKVCLVKTKGNPGKNANAPKSRKPRKCRHCKSFSGVRKNGDFAKMAGKRKTPSRGSPLRRSKRLAITNVMTTSSLDQSTNMDCDVNVCTAGRSDKMSKRLTHGGTENDGRCKERGKRLSHADSDSVRRSKRLAIRNSISTSSLEESTDRDCDGKVCTAGGPDKMSNRSTHAEIENDGDSKERSKRFSHGDSDGDCEERSNRSSHGESESDGDFKEMSNAESESDGYLDSGPIKRPDLGSFAKQYKSRANWTLVREFFVGINAYKVDTTERVMVSTVRGKKIKPPRRSLDINQATLLHAVYKGVKPNIGRMWWDTLYAAFTNNHPTASLPLGILLTRFMYACKVPILARDKLADKKTTHIGRGTISKSKGQSKIHRMVNNPVSLEGIHDMILTVQENQIEFYQMLKKVVRIVCRDDDPSDADTLDDE